MISLVLVPSTGTLATNSPLVTLLPLFFIRIDFEGSEYVAITFFFPSRTINDGVMPLPFTGLSLRSITSLVVEPVRSSTSTFIVTSSDKSLKEIVPSASAMIGKVSGSHLAISVPGSTLELSE